MKRKLLLFSALALSLGAGLGTVARGQTPAVDESRICRTKEPSPPGPDNPKPKPKRQGNVLPA